MNTSHTLWFSLTSPAEFLLRAIMLSILWLMFAGFSLAADGSIPAERDTVFFSEPPSAEDIGKHLFPATHNNGLARGISFKETQSQASLDKSVSLPILFHFGKTTITEESRPFLDRIGQMLNKTEYAKQKLIVEGHTDAVGSASSNQLLSELRALAIKRYLVTQFDIDPYRLFPVGKGETRLIQPEAPTGGLNRRVEFLHYRQQ